MAMIQGSHITRRAALMLLSAAPLAPKSARAAWPPVTVHKDPTCGCCSGWIAHLELHGFQVKTIETTALNRLKAKLGVPFELIACHTAQVGGYLIEGHVPAAAIARLLTDRPKARGLAVPGMPSGSPGMTGHYEDYEVILFDENERRVYAKFRGEKEI
jgi:hypothetical protein